MVDRRDPTWAPDERTALVDFLDYYRDTLELKTLGLTDEQAATPSCPPSGLTITGLVRHMTEVERGWFGNCIAGSSLPLLYCTDEHPDGDFDLVTPSTSLAGSVRTWREAIADSDAVLRTVSDLSAVTAQERYGQTLNVRWVLVHMIEEYARHCGHADLLRERIDGVVGD